MGSAPPHHKVLVQITNCLVEPEDHFKKIKQATDDYFQLLTSVSDRAIESFRDPVLLPSGKSIGPYWAAMCIRDMMRTKRFVRGLQLAIEHALRIFSPPVHILYAGTGPFASLALPMTTRFTPDQIQFTFLESHPKAFDLLQKTIAALDIQPYVHSTHQSDATLFTPDGEIHILLTETMQRALDHEPQVEITQHLTSFLHPGGLLLPESIKIYAGLLNPSDDLKRMQDVDLNPESYIHYVKEVLDINTCTALAYKKGFPEVELVLYPEKTGGFTRLHLFTQVTVFGNEILGPWSSGITLPKQILELDDLHSPTVRLLLQYQTGVQPGFQIRLTK